MSSRSRSVRSVVGIALSTALVSGCAGLGAVPHYVDPGAMTPRVDPLRPSYTDVKEMAYAQIKGYLVSARINRDSLYAGALMAGASATAMAALAVFAPGSPALVAIPLGGGFLSGTAAVMQNDPKAIIYSRAALRVLDQVLASDRRMVKDAATPDLEALCLRADLLVIDGRVTEHILLLNPQNVADRLRAIGSKDVVALQELARAATDYDDLLAIQSVCDSPVVRQ